MRWIAIASVLALCLARAALAQSQSAPAAEAFRPAFERPSEDVRRYYPTRALERGVPGIVLLCCRAREDRSLDCSPGAEWPQRHDFGPASLRLAETLRLTPDSYLQLRARAQQTFLLPVRWQAPPVPDELDAVAQRINEQSAEVCGAGTGRAHTEDYVLIEGVRIRRGSPSR
jgi:hypothetical protein